MTNHMKLLAAAAASVLLAACASTSPGAPSDAAAPQAATQMKTYAPGASLRWTHISDDMLSFSETVVDVGEDYILYRDPAFDADDGDWAEFYAVFSGLFLIDCPEAGEVSMTDRRALLAFWEDPQNATASARDAVNDETFDYRLVTQSTMPTPSGDRGVYWIKETTNEGDTTLYYVARDDRELVGWMFAQDDQYRLEGVTPPLAAPDPDLVARARAACAVAPFEPSAEG